MQLRGTGLFLTHEELNPRALFSVPQGEGRISKGDSTGTGQLQGWGVLGSPGTRYPGADAEAVGCAGGGTGGILVSAWQALLGTGQAGGLAGGTAAGLALTGRVNPLPSLPSEVLTRRASLLAEAAILQQQNAELCLLLEEYVSSGVSAASSSPAAWGHPTTCARRRGPRHGGHCLEPIVVGLRVLLPTGEQQPALPSHPVDGPEPVLPRGSAVSAQGQGTAFLCPELKLCLEPGLPGRD